MTTLRPSATPTRVEAVPTALMAELAKSLDTIRTQLRSARAN